MYMLCVILTLRINPHYGTLETLANNCLRPVGYGVKHSGKLVKVDPNVIKVMRDCLVLN